MVEGLTEPDALFAAQFAACPAFTMLRFDLLPVFAIVVIVIHVPVLRWIFERICVVRCHFAHLESFRRLGAIAPQAIPEIINRITGRTKVPCFLQLGLFASIHFSLPLAEYLLGLQFQHEGFSPTRIDANSDSYKSQK